MHHPLTVPRGSLFILPAKPGSKVPVLPTKLSVGLPILHSKLGGSLLPLPPYVRRVMLVQPDELGERAGTITLACALV